MQKFNPALLIIRKFAIHILIILFLVNTVILEQMRYRSNAQNACMTKEQVQLDTRCLYVYSNQVYEKGSRRSPHHGHACGSDITAIMPSFHIGNMARYMDPNYRAAVCTSQPTPTPTPTPRPTSSPSPTPSPTARPIASSTPGPTASPVNLPNGTVATLYITTLFRGITSDRGPISVAIAIGRFDSTTKLIDQTISMTHTNNGLYQGVVSLQSPLALNGPAWITLKGEKHVKRIFTNLTITNNATISLIDKPQEPGDLPTQDGVIDNNDISKILTIFAKTSQTQSDWNIADINYDKVVNSIDLGLILATLSVKSDEVIQ